MMIILESSFLVLRNNPHYIDFVSSSNGMTNEYSEHQSQARDTCQAPKYELL
jgi:hypothetical protein